MPPPTATTPWAPLRPTLVYALLALPLAACSISGLATRGLSSALAESGDVFASDDDPELVRDALPFGLKTIELLLSDRPEDTGLLLAAARGFTQYSYAFIEGELSADLPYSERERGRERALRMYLRARDYGLRGLAVDHDGIGAELSLDPAAATQRLELEDVELTFWTALAWGAAISLGQERPELVADIDAVRALLGRALELDAGFDEGAVHVALIRIESLPEMMGGSPERAREHFERAVGLSDGRSAAPYLAFASSLSVANQDRAEFEELLGLALAIDPDATPSLRLANHLDQRRARVLLERADDLFLEPLE